jgi:hypothetical protein
VDEGRASLLFFISAVAMIMFFCHACKGVFQCKIPLCSGC